MYTHTYTHTHTHTHTYTHTHTHKQVPLHSIPYRMCQLNILNSSEMHPFPLCPSFTSSFLRSTYPLFPSTHNYLRRSRFFNSNISLPPIQSFPLPTPICPLPPSLTSVPVYFPSFLRPLLPSFPPPIPSIHSPTLHSPSASSTAVSDLLLNLFIFFYSFSERRVFIWLTCFYRCY